MNVCEPPVPGLLLCETHFAFRKEKGIISDAVARIADEGFFGAISIADVENKAGRNSIRKTVEAHDVALSQWTSMVLGDEELDLCSMDTRHRTRSVARITELIDQAAECGVRNLGLLSGPDPGEELRAQATASMFESLSELCDVISTYPGMRLMLEPLDQDIHKKGLIGPTTEAVALVGHVQESFPAAGLCLDTGHAVLLGEDPVNSLELMGPHILEIHFSNPVLDRNDPTFGDMHGPPGPPGVLDVADFARVLSKGIETGIVTKGRPIVSVEVRTTAGGDPWETVELCKTTISRTWELVQASGKGSVGSD